MKVTAAIESNIPTTIGVVSGSPKANVPTNIAVTGSKTPSTLAFVGPILRVAMARVAVENVVGNMAKPMRLPQAPMSASPDKMEVPEQATQKPKTTVPVRSE